MLAKNPPSTNSDVAIAQHLDAICIFGNRHIAAKLVPVRERTG